MNATKIDLTIPTTPAELVGLFFTVGQFSDQLRNAVGANEEACVIICVTINASQSLEFRAVEAKRLSSAIDYVRKVAHGSHPFRLASSNGLLSIVPVDAAVESTRKASRKASASERKTLRDAAEAKQAAKLADYDRACAALAEANIKLAEANTIIADLRAQLDSEVTAHAVSRAAAMTSMTSVLAKRARRAA